MNLTFIFFQAASPKGPFEFVFQNCFKPPVLRDRLNLSFILFQAASPKGPFEFVFQNCFKPPVLRDRLNLTFILFQTASPKGPFEFIFSNWFERSAHQRAASVYLFKLFRAVSPPTGSLSLSFQIVSSGQPTNGQLEFIFSNCFERSAHQRAA